jgi:hypothetical protein
MPTFRQAKLTAWETLKEIARPIPGVKPNESELLIKYPDTGYGETRVQLIGADNPDSLRGPALSGVSMDEYSQIAPQLFGEIISKALGDHLGYAIFAGTIKGHDQLYKLHEAVKANPEWFALWQDIDVSLATEAGPTISALKQAMEDDRKLVQQGVMTQAEFDQEWFLSPEAAIKGAIYEKEMSAAKVQGRITRVPLEPELPVDTDWDLGLGGDVSGNTAIWFSQSLRSGEVRLIDYYENSGEGFPHYASVLQQRGYVYGEHWGPHDINVREMGSGKSRLETAANLGIRFKVCPNIAVNDGIQASRMLLTRCWFDEEKCARGLEALRHYRKSYNTRLQEFTDTPVHDWSEHGASAFRYLAVRHKAPRDRQRYQDRFVGSAPSPTAWMG